MRGGRCRAGRGFPRARGRSLREEKRLNSGSSSSAPPRCVENRTTPPRKTGAASHFPRFPLRGYPEPRRGQPDTHAPLPHTFPKAERRGGAGCGKGRSCARGMHAVSRGSRRLGHGEIGRHETGGKGRISSAFRRAHASAQGMRSRARKQRQNGPDRGAKTALGTLGNGPSRGSERAQLAGAWSCARKPSTRSFTSASACIVSVTFSTAYRTVEWSRPPKNPPISSSEWRVV